MIQHIEKMKKLLRNLKGTINGLRDGGTGSFWEKHSWDGVFANAKIMEDYLDKMVVSGHIQHSRLISCMQAIENASDLFCSSDVEILLKELRHTHEKMVGKIKI